MLFDVILATAKYFSYRLSGEKTVVTENNPTNFYKGFYTRLGHLFVRYSAAADFHSSEIKIKSWTTEAKKIRVLMPPSWDVRVVSKLLERAGFEKISNK